MDIWWNLFFHGEKENKFQKKMTSIARSRLKIYVCTELSPEMEEIINLYWGVNPKNDSDNEDNYSSVTVSEKDNEITYAGIVYSSRINDALEAIRKLAVKARDEMEETLLKNPEIDPVDRKKTIIKFFINSPGGFVYDAFRFMDIVNIFVNCYPIEIHTYIVGYAFSAGTLMASVGSKRYATKRSHIMIHELFGGMMGSYSQLKSRFKNIDMIHEGIIRTYLTINRLKTREEIEELLKKESWFDAQGYYEQGFLDGVI